MQKSNVKWHYFQFFIYIIIMSTISREAQQTKSIKNKTMAAAAIGDYMSDMNQYVANKPCMFAQYTYGAAYRPHDPITFATYHNTGDLPQGPLQGPICDEGTKPPTYTHGFTTPTLRLTPRAGMVRTGVIMNALGKGVAMMSGGAAQVMSVPAKIWQAFGGAGSGETAQVMSVPAKIWQAFGGAGRTTTLPVGKTQQQKRAEKTGMQTRDADFDRFTTSIKSMESMDGKGGPPLRLSKIMKGSAKRRRLGDAKKTAPLKGGCDCMSE